MKKLIFLLLVFSAFVFAQPSTRVFPRGASLPTKCSIGDGFYKTGATPGQYNCTSNNVWTIVSGGGGGGGVCPAGASGAVQQTNGTNCADSGLTSDGAGNATGNSLTLKGPFNGSDWPQGFVSSTGPAFTVLDSAGTSITLVWPTWDGMVDLTGKVLSDSGAITCPVHLPPGFPAVCHQMAWIAASGGASLCGPTVGGVQLYASAMAFGCDSQLVWDSTNHVFAIGPALSTVASGSVGAGSIFNQVNNFPLAISAVSEVTDLGDGTSGGVFSIGVLNAGAGTNSGPSYGTESTLLFSGPTNYSGTGNTAMAANDAQILLNGYTGTISEVYAYQVDALPNINAMGATITTYGGLHVLQPQSMNLTITNEIGVNIEDQVLGMNNWAIKTGLGKVQLGDQAYLSGNVVNPFEMTKNTQSATAPGAATCDLRWIAGTSSTTGKIVAACGTSATEVTIADNVGGGF